MKTAFLAIPFALALAGCAAGVSVGSATYRADDQGETLCSHSYGAGISAPDTQDSDVHRRGGCVRSPADEE